MSSFRGIEPTPHGREAYAARMQNPRTQENVISSLEGLATVLENADSEDALSPGNMYPYIIQFYAAGAFGDRFDPKDLERPLSPTAGDLSLLARLRQLSTPLRKGETSEIISRLTGMPIVTGTQADQGVFDQYTPEIAIGVSLTALNLRSVVDGANNHWWSNWFPARFRREGVAVMQIADGYRSSDRDLVAPALFFIAGRRFSRDLI